MQAYGRDCCATGVIDFQAVTVVVDGLWQAARRNKLLLFVVDLWPIYRKGNASRFTEQVLMTSIAVRCL